MSKKTATPFAERLRTLWYNTLAALVATRREDYKATWKALSRTAHQATVHVIGDVDEDRIREAAAGTVRDLESSVGIRPGDTILEIGCGIGRVGQALAPRCREWIGCDVSPHMLAYARERLANLANARLVEVSGRDLAPVPDASVDLVYCTVVFMHIDEWDRYTYVREALRILKPGGRLFVDNFSLTTDEGWAIFEYHVQEYAKVRPSHISRASTPQELEAYLRRAGFRDVQVRERGAWAQAFGLRPAADARPTGGNSGAP